MRKVTSDKLTAGMLSNNVKDKVKDFIASGEAFTFMNGIKGKPAYLKKFSFDVLVIVKQLGCPTLFMMLSSADMRWNELISVIAKLNNFKLSEGDIESILYHDKCKLLNSNPVLVARRFQYPVEGFFTGIAIDGPLGKLNTMSFALNFKFMACLIYTVSYGF